jgi:spermidine/putrescine transport system substrate-binding protein
MMTTGGDNCQARVRRNWCILKNDVLFRWGIVFITRMKQSTILSLGLALLALTGCGPSKPVLHVYNWADYIKPELVTRFEQENNCQVRIDTFDSNEAMYAKIKAGGTGYDLIFPSSYMVKLMIGNGLLQPLDPARLPNLKNLDPAVNRMIADPAFGWSVPYMMCNAGIAYDGARVKDFEPTWGMFGRADLKGRMTMLNDMRETIGAGLKFRGYSLNSTNDQELAEARDVVIGWKKNLAKFENEQYKNGIASGEFLLVHGYNGDILQVMEEQTNVMYAVPREGCSISFDEMVIPKDASQVALALAFINFLHEPEVAAANSEAVCYLCPNAASYAFLSDEFKSNESIFIPAALLEKCESINDLGPDQAKYTAIWDVIKSAE